MNTAIETKGRHPDLVVRLVGQGVDPSVVPVRSLARILGAMQRLVDQKDDEEESDSEETDVVEQEDPSRVLHLMDVKSSSAAYYVGTSKRELLFQVLNGLKDSILAPSKSDWLDSTISSIKELSEVAKGLRCSIELREPENGSFGSLITSIEPGTYDRVKGSAFVYGYTSVFAKIERVGGSTARHCHIRLPNTPRKVVVCGVDSNELVRRLGQHIYEHVLLTGYARWSRYGWRLKRLEISDFKPPKNKPIAETMDRLRALDNGVWDSIEDPDAYISDMRRS